MGGDKAVTGRLTAAETFKHRRKNQEGEKKK
jgi:hypothetical protein